MEPWQAEQVLHCMLIGISIENTVKYIKTPYMISGFVQYIRMDPGYMGPGVLIYESSIYVPPRVRAKGAASH